VTLRHLRIDVSKDAPLRSIFSSPILTSGPDNNILPGDTWLFRQIFARTLCCPRSFGHRPFSVGFFSPPPPEVASCRSSFPASIECFFLPQSPCEEVDFAQDLIEDLLRFFFLTLPHVFIYCPFSEADVSQERNFSFSRPIPPDPWFRSLWMQ